VAPQENLKEIYTLCKEQAEKEELTRRAILDGATVDELLERFGRI
jgi:hypothetical protein